MPRFLSKLTKALDLNWKTSRRSARGRRLSCFEVERLDERVLLSVAAINYPMSSGPVHENTFMTCQGKLHLDYWDGASWRGVDLQNGGSAIASDPAVSNYQVGSVLHENVYVRGGDGNLYTDTWDPAKWIWTWAPLGNGGSRLGTMDTSYATWQQVFQVNFFAPIMLARGLVEELEAAKGAVVNVTSIAGSKVHPFAGAAYATSKAALASLTREMASDFGPRGIRVNAIAPGEIDTAILSPGTEKIVAQIPLRRLGTTDEVAKIIYVLCTEVSSYVNGAEVHINGGQYV